MTRYISKMEKYNIMLYWKTILAITFPINTGQNSSKNSSSCIAKPSVYLKIKIVKGMYHGTHFVRLRPESSSGHLRPVTHDSSENPIKPDL